MENSLNLIPRHHNLPGVDELDKVLKVPILHILKELCPVFFRRLINQDEKVVVIGLIQIFYLNFVMFYILYNIFTIYN